MNIIFFSRREGRARHFNLGHPLAVTAFATVLVAILATAFSLGLKIGESNSQPRGASTWSQTLAEQQAEIKELKAELQRRVDAVAMRIGQMNAHVIRLDALGKRLTQMANIDNREFDFESSPRSAARRSDAGSRDHASLISRRCSTASNRRSPRATRRWRRSRTRCSQSELDEQIRPDGRPCAPATFLRISANARIHSRATRRSTRASTSRARRARTSSRWPRASSRSPGEKTGYGTLVEVSHGNGLVTRYGHNQGIAVTVGRTVARGDTLAYVGSTGRSTGPHVHFEVLKNGRQVNPLTFIGR